MTHKNSISQAFEEQVQEVPLTKEPCSEPVFTIEKDVSRIKARK